MHMLFETTKEWFLLILNAFQIFFPSMLDNCYGSRVKLQIFFLLFKNILADQGQHRTEESINFPFATCELP